MRLQKKQHFKRFVFFKCYAIHVLVVYCNAPLMILSLYSNGVSDGGRVRHLIFF